LPRPEIRKGNSRFGFAYYIDGSFKKYLFNNIAWGKNNIQGSKNANCSGLQEIIVCGGVKVWRHTDPLKKRDT
jgi:hypothetical protein